MTWRDSVLTGTGQALSAQCIWDLPCLATNFALVLGSEASNFFSGQPIFSTCMKLKETGEGGEDMRRSQFCLLN